MIKCFFVDIANISSETPRSNFEESDLEQLADLILQADGLLRPLIIKESGLEKYTVVEGHREYYAAVKAKEKDRQKAEMVNAFVIPIQTHVSAIDQLNLLKLDNICLLLISFKLFFKKPLLIFLVDFNGVFSCNL